MSSLGEQMAQEQSEKAKKLAEKLTKPIGNGTYKGICLVVKAAEFGVDALMAAVKDCIFDKTGDFKYSNRNIKIDDLKKSGRVSIISETVTAETMQYFDKYCKEYGIKYSAMKDLRAPSSPQYLVFFQSDHADLIMKALQEGYKDFSRAASFKSKMQGKEANSEERDSVVGKLYSFCSRLEHTLNEGAEHIKSYHNEIAR